MTITTLPTRAPSDLGAALVNARTPNANELSAVNVEALKTRLIAVATEVGLTSGATPGSLNQFRSQLAGLDSAILRRVGATFGHQRIGGGLSDPTASNGALEGYAPGSWWVRTISALNPATAAFFVCIDATAGAAVWIPIGGTPGISKQQITIAANVNNLALPGLSHNAHYFAEVTGSARILTGIVAPADMLRVDILNVGPEPLVIEHVSASSNAANTISCPGAAPLTVRRFGAVGLIYDPFATVWRVAAVPDGVARCTTSIAIATSVTLAPGDAVAMVAGRATRSDGRAGSNVPGYIGQCVIGGTGDAGGFVLASVVVEGRAPATGLTAGAPVYLSTSAIGAVTSTIPSGLGAIEQRIGVAISATEFALQIDAPRTIDYCSPLDISTNGIFYGRADSSNVLDSGRVSSVGNLFVGSPNTCVRDALGNSPEYMANGGPGSACWRFVKAVRNDRLRIPYHASMTGLAWSALVVQLPMSTSWASFVSKGANNPFDFSTFGGNGAGSVTVDSTPADVPRMWRADSFSREGGSGPANVFSRGANVATGVSGAHTSGTEDIMVGNRPALDNALDGRIAAVAVWNRVLTGAEHAGLARWAARTWAL